MEELLKQANIPESWWPNCYIADNDMIFTPVFDDAGSMIKTGNQAYQEWLQVKDNPPAPTPSATEQQLAAMALTQAEQASTIETLQQSNAALMLRLAELGGNA